jgi:hypothetical protein
VPSSIEITRRATRRELLTIEDLRSFLAECDRVGFPADLPLRAGTSFRGWLRSIVATNTSPKSASPKSTSPGTGQKAAVTGRKTPDPGLKSASARKNEGESGSS